MGEDTSDTDAAGGRGSGSGAPVLGGSGEGAGAVGEEYEGLS